MSTLLIIVLIASMGLALFAVIAGMLVMAKGGESSKKYSNRLMQFRVSMQAVALLSFIMLILTSG